MTLRRRRRLAPLVAFALAGAGCRAILGIEPLPANEAGDSAVGDAPLEASLMDAAADGNEAAEGSLHEAGCVVGCTPIGDAAGWTAQDGGVDADLSAVWGVGTGASEPVYAVGTNGTILYSTGNGVWTLQDSGMAGILLTAVWGSGPEDVYVTANGGGLAHSDGTGVWTVIRPETSMTSAWGSSSTDVYFGADQTMYRYSGTGQIFPSTDLSMLPWAIWGSGPADVYAVGVAVDASLAAPVIHSTGNSEWTTVTSYSPTGAQYQTSLYGVWGSGPGDVYAVGGDPGDQVGTILHYAPDGGWQAQISPTIYVINGVWGSSSTDVYGVTSGAIVHSAGDGTWSSTNFGVGNGLPVLKSVWGSAAEDVYVVGTGGTILHHP